MTIPDTTMHTGAMICRRVSVFDAVASEFSARMVTMSEAV